MLHVLYVVVLLIVTEVCSGQYMRQSVVLLKPEYHAITALHGCPQRVSILFSYFFSLEHNVPWSFVTTGLIVMREMQYFFKSEIFPRFSFS